MMVLVTHPNNARYLRLLNETLVAQTADKSQLPLEGYMFVTYYMHHLPERDLETVWEPPPPEKFFIYGPEDRCWMEPLGLGRKVIVDHGPLIYEVDAFDFSFRRKIHASQYGLV